MDTTGLKDNKDKGYVEAGLDKVKETFKSDPTTTTTTTHPTNNNLTNTTTSNKGYVETGLDKVKETFATGKTDPKEKGYIETGVDKVKETLGMNKDPSSTTTPARPLRETHTTTNTTNPQEKGYLETGKEYLDAGATKIKETVLQLTDNLTGSENSNLNQANKAKENEFIIKQERELAKEKDISRADPTTSTVANLKRENNMNLHTENANKMSSSNKAEMTKHQRDNINELNKNKQMDHAAATH